MSVFILLLGPPLASALLAVAVKPYRQFVGWANALLSPFSIGAAVALWGHVLAGDVLTSRLAGKRIQLGEISISLPSRLFSPINLAVALIRFVLKAPQRPRSEVIHIIQIFFGSLT